jgi:tetratricopeptide (TPR) repeat protein
MHRRSFGSRARWVAPLCCLTLLTACKKENATVAPDPDPSDAGEEAVGERPDAPEHVGDFKQEDLDRLKLMGAEIVPHIEAAKSAVEAEDWATAISEYAAALELDPDNPHLHAALGWADFNSGQLDDAEIQLRLALRFEQDYRRRAAYLYKLGRVDEERGDWPAAKQHYDHSLRLVDDPDARAHVGAVAKKAAKACKKGRCEQPDYVDLAAACDAMMERLHLQLGLQTEEDDQGFTCEPDKAERVTLEGGDATEAVLLTISGEHGIVEEAETDLLAHISGGWHWVGTVLDVENPHKDGVFRSGRVVSFEAKEVMPDSPGPEVLVHVQIDESDSELDDNIAYHDEHEAMIVCGINHGRHECRELGTRLLFEAEALDVTRPMSPDRETERREFEVAADFDGAGKVTFAGSGDLPEGLVGTHELASYPEPHGYVFLHDD